jgi:hypothetical protein
MKKYRLNLMHEDTKDLVPFIWNMPFSEACNHVKTQAHLQVITSMGTAKRKLRSGCSANSAKADAYNELMEAFASCKAAVAARDLPSDMVLSPELFQCIPPSARPEFRQKRAALAKCKQGEMTQGQADTWEETEEAQRHYRGNTMFKRSRRTMQAKIPMTMIRLLCLVLKRMTFNHRLYWLITKLLWPTLLEHWKTCRWTMKRVWQI